MQDALKAITSYFNDVGAAVVLPILITVLAIVLGQKASRAARSGVLIGIGFIGVGLVIGLLFAQVSPAAQALAQRFDVDLGIVDVGWPSSAAIAFGSTVGALIIPFCLVLNVVLLLVGLTRTFDIDLWNYWHFALSGALVAAVSDNLWLGLATAGVSMVITLALADWSAPLVQKYFQFPDISFPHATAAPYAVFAIPLNWLFDRTPGLRNLHADPLSIQKRFGVFGESMFLGLVIGLVLGLAGYGFDDPRADSISILTLGINVAAIMLLLPRMVAILMEGLIPVSEAAREFLARKFPGKKFYIGLDAALAVGQPAVLATALLLVPITIVLAIALAPVGNQVLPLVDLATIPFIIAIMVPIFRGNIVRSVIGGALVIGGGLFIATAISGTFTQVATDSGFTNEQGASRISSLVDGANPLTGLLTWLGSMGAVGVLVGAVLSIVLAVAISRVVKRRDRAEAAEVEAAAAPQASA
ncbi:PTS galactitol transporter subunit IIC [Klenkia taihuensis]|uniref:PTS system IIC component, Gat family (TC 4.A.5) n=1 Tax=Klenkia taihuensis TaxID=1225127 RepID=A0A1I1N3B4_9ACTN|nr:PTS transporter subunit IIC [Klenkia taihuensis]GHE12264.1 PTS galactitol transporter subunit IIC [Klenkia taihuensis]SFC92109.1 PTS system IIC component, Gat family (TC 4.A.5) [Klenkia taihuensis]